LQVLTKDISCALLAEPHHSLAEGTRILLATLFDTVVMVADEGSLIEAAERVRPGLVVVDLLLAKKNLAALTSRIHEASPESKVIVLSVHDEAAVVRAVIDAGADGFVVKRAIGTELIAAVTTVLRGERYAPSSR
jgi:DNA-binding NarL/FixJ family response regulator